MALRYEIQQGLIPLKKDQSPDEGSPIVEVLCNNEFEKLGELVDKTMRHNITALLTEESCFVSEYPQCILGSLAVPNKEHAMGDRRLFSFYWDKSMLIFIDESSISAHTLKRVAASGVEINSLASCLQEFLRELLAGDITWLADLEDKIENAEETMLNNKKEFTWGNIASLRRLTVRMAAYYEQFSTMAETLAENENGMLTAEESKGFRPIVNMADRLLHRAETIREYTLVLRELHQTQIDSRQSSTIQLLTVVTILFAPMELITGWFGMDLAYLPGRDEAWGFPLVCLSILIITGILIVWFHRKRWI